jgi:hypothetical protein
VKTWITAHTDTRGKYQLSKTMYMFFYCGVLTGDVMYAATEVLQKIPASRFFPKEADTSFSAMWLTTYQTTRHLTQKYETHSKHRVCLLSCPWTRPLRRKESLHPPGLLVTADVLKNTTKATPCISPAATGWIYFRVLWNFFPSIQHTSRGLRRTKR